ncbi:MAG: YhgE/Pip domain-containing protein [Clostridium sp.]|nr:YhgE/Pip domain-containing protein [Clostridium sp.]
MKNVFRILFRDLKNIIKNPAAIIIVVGLFFIPSLYAWVNIKANWNPYTNTENLPVAVVNKDNGAYIDKELVNVGDEVIEALKKNDSIGWKFVGDWQGNYGLNEGKYYALIEIPANFSERLISLTTTMPQKPSIIYRANEKENAIANKITNVAKDKLTEQIKEEIITTINTDVFDKLNVVGDDIYTRKSQILELVNTINGTDSKLKDISSQLLSADKDISLLQNNMNTSKENLSKAENTINSLQTLIQNSNDLTMDTKVQLAILSSNLKQNMITLQNQERIYEEQVNSLKDSASAKVDKDKINDLVNRSKDSINSTNNAIDSEISALEPINNSSAVSQGIDSLKSLKQSNENRVNALNSINDKVQSGAENTDLQNSLNDLTNINNSFNSILNSINASFYDSIIPMLNVASDNLINVNNKANSVLNSLKVLNPQIRALMNLGIANGDVAKSQLNDINTKLDELRNNLSSIQEKTSDINDETLNDVIDLLGKNPDTMANFLASPLNVDEVEVYDISIFGIGLTPFYTVLGIWVGILLTLALLTTECKDLDIDGETTIMQKHFGKMLLFLIISFVQTFIVTLGDILVLKVTPENVPLFFGVAFLTSFAFTMITYTLVSLFGNVGKAIAVVIMVFQIAGSGGIYPIQTNPKIFGMLQPLWPFTYAIDAFRQSIAGPTWSTTLSDIRALLFFAVFFIVLGSLKRFVYKITEFFDEKFKEAEL